jgi:hypothetical protein
MRGNLRYGPTQAIQQEPMKSAHTYNSSRMVSGAFVPGSRTIARTLSVVRSGTSGCPSWRCALPTRQRASPGTCLRVPTFPVTAVYQDLTHGYKSEAHYGMPAVLRNLQQPQFRSDTFRILAAAGQFPTLASSSGRDYKA